MLCNRRVVLIVKQLTLKQLSNTIKYWAKLNPEAKVYMSSDTEGNSYGTITADSFSFGENDKSFIMYPWEELLKKEKK